MNIVIYTQALNLYSLLLIRLTTDDVTTKNMACEKRQWQ